jgi:protein TonB
MTMDEFSRVTRSRGPHQTHGWMVSMICHILAVGCALMLMAEVENPALPESFQWEVTMVEAPAPAEPAPVEPVPPEHPPVKPVRQTQPAPKPVEPVQQVVREVAPTVEAREPVQQVVREVAPAVETVEAVQQPAPEVVTTVNAALERPAVETTEAPTVIARAVTSSPVPVIEQTLSEAAISSAVERPVESLDARPLVQAAPQARSSEPIERASPVVETVPSGVEHRIIQQRQVKYRQTQADYGWLRDALWGRIHELKRYPSLARANHWEGKVVVEAIIRDDGEVVGLKVAESSGRAILDEDAMAVMKKASPLTLKHPLGKRQITILIPINYRLDG